jgi:hypothetical protein
MASSASTDEQRVNAEDAKSDILVEVSNLDDKKNKAIWLRTNPSQELGDTLESRKIKNGTIMRLDPSKGVQGKGCVYAVEVDNGQHKTEEEWVAKEGWVKMKHLKRVSPRMVDMSEEFWEEVDLDRDFARDYDKNYEIDGLKQKYNTTDYRAQLSQEERSDYEAFKEYVKRLLTKGAPSGAEAVAGPAQGGSRRRKSKISRRRRRRHNSKRNRKNTHTHKRKRRTHRRH